MTKEQEIDEILMLIKTLWQRNRDMSIASIVCCAIGLHSFLDLWSCRNSRLLAGLKKIDAEDPGFNAG